MSPARKALISIIRLYQIAVSPYLGMNCRFQPTCSAYACDAVAAHGALRGSLLGLRRIGRCHPWGGEGYDPIPEHSPKHHLTTEPHA